MTHWGRVPTETLCGYCNAHLMPGSPALFRTLPNVKRVQVRGECCAGPAPMDLALPIIYRQSLQAKRSQPAMLSPMTRFKDTIPKEYLPYKESREPGEDD